MSSTPTAGSSSGVPAYEPPSPSAKDAIRRNRSLSADYPDPNHPVHQALLSSVDLKVDSANIYAFSQGGILVDPRALDSSPVDPKSWGQARGYLVIVSTTRRRIDQIRVQLVTRQTLRFPQDKGSVEKDEAFVREITHGDKQSGGVWLEQGINSFEYLINLPPDACVTEWATLDPRIFNFVVGTAVGSAKGIFGKDLTAEKQVFVIDAPADREELALNLHVEALQNDLGPCSLDVVSALFIVAGAVSLVLKLHSPPPTLKIYALKAYIDQTIQLTSFRDPSKRATAHQKGVFVERGWSGPYTTQALEQIRQNGTERDLVLFDASATDGEWVYEDVVRLANARSLSCTTHPRTQTCVRASSELVVELFFTSSGPDLARPSKVRVATILRKPVHLGSCGLLPERLFLPDYVPGPEKLPNFLKPRIPCQCDDHDDDKVLQVERDHLLRRQLAAIEDPDAALLPPNKKIGEIS